MYAEEVILLLTQKSQLPDWWITENPISLLAKKS
jgi:hypothetical protein